MKQRASIDSRASGTQETAREMAAEFGRIFVANDLGQKTEAIESCVAVDRLQFQHLDEVEVEQASRAYVEALWEKDELELQYLWNGRIDPDAIREADYSPVRQKLRQRASIIGADQRYAVEKTDAWRAHKAGEDYWTPYQRAQVYELRAALQDPTYPNKPRYGQSGPGPEPMRYALAAELHDMNTDRHHHQGIEVLTPYFARILEAHDE